MTTMLQGRDTRYPDHLHRPRPGQTGAGRQPPSSRQQSHQSQAIECGATARLELPSIDLEDDHGRSVDQSDQSSAASLAGCTGGAARALGRNLHVVEASSEGIEAAFAALAGSSRRPCDWTRPILCRPQRADRSLALARG